MIAPEVALYQDEDAFDTALYVWFDLFSRRADGLSTGDFYLFGCQDVECNNLLWTMYAKSIMEREDGWSFVAYISSQALAGVGRLRLIIYNSSAFKPLEVDDLVVIQENSPKEFVGHLLRAEHYGEFNVTQGTAPSVLWVPLPIGHGIQVPLYLDLEVNPPQIVEKIEYVVEETTNFGTKITIKAEEVKSILSELNANI